MKIPFSADEFESAYFTAIAKSIRFMGKMPPKNEPFYGLALYVDTYYTDSGVYFASPSEYSRSMTQVKPERRQTKEQRWHWRWNCGDWEYSSLHGKLRKLQEFFAEMGEWASKASKQMERQDLTSDDWFDYQFRVMTSACRVGKRLLDEKLYDTLPRTKDFNVVISDHDEALIYSYLRLDRFVADGSVLIHGYPLGAKINDELELRSILAAWQEE